MAKFSVFFKRKKIGEFEFDGGRVRVGRHPESEIFLPHQSISRLHAAFIQREGRWLVENVGGQNGVFLNGGLVKRTKVLEDGAKVELGKYIIHYDAGEAESSDLMAELAKMRSGGAEKPTFTDAPVVAPRPTGLEHIDGTLRMAPDRVVKERHESAALMGPHLAWTSDAGEKMVIPLGKSATTIGSSDDADIIIDPGLLTGKQHATIQQKGGRFVIEPSAWWCKVTINGRRVRAATPLTEGDAVNVSGTAFTFRAPMF